MAVDVLSYNALNCRTQAEYNCIIKEYRKNFSERPWETCYWTNEFLPMCITSGGTVLNVCDTSGNFRAGVCCLWTVPAGVTRAQFQLWGAGGGTGGASCCGFVPPGSTGAYAIVTIPVTAGCQYTICSGCAFCCYAQDPVQTGACNVTNGCASFVQGFGLTNFCAEGGRTGLGTCGTSTIYGDSTQRFQPLCSNGLSHCYGGAAYCGSCYIGLPLCYCYCSSVCVTSMSGSLFNPILKSDRTFYGNTTTSGVNVCGLPSMFAGVCLFPSFCGYFLVPPIPSPNNSTTHAVHCCHFDGGQFCQTFSSVPSGFCGGWCCAAISTNATCPMFRWPGQGAVGAIVKAGGFICGDVGRMGMVRVTYC